jgi:hypothetical protein
MRFSVSIPDELYDEVLLAATEYQDGGNVDGTSNKFNHSYLVQVALEQLVDKSRAVIAHRLKVAEYNTRVATQQVARLREKLEAL